MKTITSLLIIILLVGAVAGVIIVQEIGVPSPTTTPTLTSTPTPTPTPTLTPTPTPPATPTPTTPTPTVTPTSTHEIDLPRFEDISTTAGLHNSTVSFGNPILGDINKDGLLDMIAPSHSSRPAIYINSGNGTYTDIFNETGISYWGKGHFRDFRNDRHGFALGDFNDDGNLDLYVSKGAWWGLKIGEKSDELWQGDGKGHFVDVTKQAGVENRFGRGRSAFWVDFNNDGYLDLYVQNCLTPNILYKNLGNGTFVDVTEASGLRNIRGTNTSWADYDNDGFTDVIITGQENVTATLLRNNGDETFTDMTESAGLEKMRFTKGVAWGDYDNDGDLDLYIARAYHDLKNSLVWNNTMITIADVETESMVISADQDDLLYEAEATEIDRKADGVDFQVVNASHLTVDAYVNGTSSPQFLILGSAGFHPQELPISLDVTDSELVGKAGKMPQVELGIFLWRNTSDGEWHIRYQNNERRNVFYITIRTDGSFVKVQPTFSPKKVNVDNVLYRNNGDGTFTDVTAAAGLKVSANTPAAAWGDFDNDGFLDLYVTNAGDVSGGLPNFLFRNNGDGTFTEVGGQTRANLQNDGSRHLGVAWGDLNNDGFLDLVLTNGYLEDYPLAFGPDKVLLNGGNQSNWLKIHLTPTFSIGTKITLRIGGAIQFRELDSSGGGVLFSQGVGPVHFGLGQNTMVDTIIVKYPEGRVHELRNVKANQTLALVEEESSTFEAFVRTVTESQADLAPASQPQYLVLTSIDGGRGDYLNWGSFPNLNSLAANGMLYKDAWVGQWASTTPTS